MDLTPKIDHPPRNTFQFQLPGHSACSVNENSIYWSCSNQPTNQKPQAPEPPPSPFHLSPDHPLRHPTGSSLDAHPEHPTLPTARSRRWLSTHSQRPCVPRSPCRRQEPSGLVQAQHTRRPHGPPPCTRTPFSPPPLQHGAWGAAVSVQPQSTSGELFQGLWH